MRLLLSNRRFTPWQVFVAIAFSVTVFFFVAQLRRPGEQVHDFRGHPPKINDISYDSVVLGASTESDQVNPDAHSLQDADAFRSHFRALLSASNLTVAEANATCHWDSEDAQKINFEKAANHEWTKHNPPEEEVAALRGRWQKFLATQMIPYAPHKDRYKGRGIVIVAGNEHTLTRTRTVLRALKKLGSKLPVQVHYWGEEMDQKAKDRIAEIYPNSFFNDLADRSNNVFAAKWLSTANYQYKTAALVNSRFAETLLLDSDNIPIIDPEELFESPLYKKYGTLFWPDVARTRPNNPAWAITNTACRENEYEQESGQLVVDNRRFFYHLQLAAFWSNVQGSYYTRILLGDKDMFRFAWHALKTKYGFPPKWLTSVGTLHDDFYCGHTFAQHHPDGRVAFMHGGLLKTYPKPLLKWYRQNAGGVHHVYKRSRFDEQHQLNEEIEFYFDGNFWLPNRPEDMRASWCLSFRGVDHRPLEEIAPGFDKIFDEVGGYWMLDA